MRTSAATVIGRPGHQNFSPVMNASDGTITVRTRRVSSSTPMHTMIPICVSVISGSTPSTANTAASRMPALVITLGTLYAYRGINVLWTGSDRINSSDMPKEFLALGTSLLLYIPWLTIIAVIVLLIAGWFLYTQRAGRELYAIGSDPAAANLYGLKVTQRVLVAFVVSGALAGRAGVLYAARYGTVNSQAGVNLELQAVGAAVIGGVAIFGGSGTVWGAAIGAFLLVTINRALPIIGVQDFWQRAVVGVLIIGAIVLDRVLALRQAKKLVEMRDDS